MIAVRIRKKLPPGPGSAGFSLEIDLQAGAGVTVLFGPSGAGKSLTLDSIAGFVRPDEGRILLDDQILFDAESGVHLSPQARHCGYVFQNYALFPHMTLRKNLEFAAERIPRLERHRKVTEMIERFRLSDVSGRRPLQLSGGQKQRCSIARALIGSPRILLLDEPARGLDAPLRAELYATLRQVRADFGTPILLVTHDFNECFELADEMAVVKDGRVVQTGAPKKVYEQPGSADVARLFGAYNLVPVEIRALDPGRNSSRLRYRDFDLAGPYFPGRLIGDHGWLCVRPEQLSAVPQNGKPGLNQVAAALIRVVDKPQSTRLEFADDIAVEMPGLEASTHRHIKDWLIEFPQHNLKLL